MSIFWPKIIFSKLPKNMLFLGMENCILSLSGVRKVFWCFVKGTCLRLSWFPFFSFFYDHFSLWTFGGSTGNFFSGSQSLLSFSGSLKLRFSFTGKTQKALLTRKKNSLSHHQMSFRKSSRQKNGNQLRRRLVLSHAPEKLYVPQKDTRTDHFHQ